MRRKSQHGITLIEVLVSMAVLSIGLLGAAGLMITSMRNVSEQGNNAMAMNFAREIAERMMSNSPQSLLQVNNPYVFDSRTGTWPTISVNCNTNTCTEAQRAQWDVAEIVDRIRNLSSTGTAAGSGRAALPNVAVRICFDSVTAGGGTDPNSWDCNPNQNRVLVVKIGWDARETTGEFITDTRARAVYVVSPGIRIPAS
jgi:type IV pilus assembly protein PilV